jgi:hypothetical protein
VTTGARMLRDGRVPSRIWARSGACEPRGRRFDDGDERDERVAWLVARQRDGDVVEPRRPGERHLQRRPSPWGTA